MIRAHQPAIADIALTQIAEFEKTIAGNFAIYENALKKSKTQISTNTQKLQQIKARKQGMELSLKTKEQQIKAADIAHKSNQAKIAETREELRLKEIEQEQAKQNKLDCVASMNAKQKSFVLQKAMETRDADIIDLLRLTDFDISFQNGEGQSLIDTATILGDLPMLDYLNGHE
jgi:hypothetical protein